MDLKRKIIKDVASFFDSGEPEIELHLMKLLMWYSKCEGDLMELSHNNHEEFKNVITEIVDVIISDFKNCYNLVPKASERQNRFIIRRTETFNKNMRFNVLLTVTDFDLIMNELDTEYRKIIGNVQLNVPKNNQSTNQNKEGCYIATMVYGDYDHQNVIELRNYRDNSLNKTYLGKTFIKLYYQTSPILVRKIEHNCLLNMIIKSILDKIVYKIKSKNK